MCYKADVMARSFSNYISHRDFVLETRLTTYPIHVDRNPLVFGLTFIASELQMFNNN